MKKGIIITVVLLIVFGTMGYFLYSLNKENNNLKSQINGSNDNNSQGDDTNTMAIKFDKTKCLNCKFDDENKEINILINSSSIPGINFYNQDENRKTLSMKVNYCWINPNYNNNEINLSSCSEDTKDITFDKSVEMVFLGIYGKENDKKVFYFLLEDGTVEKMKVTDISNKNFNHETVQGISNIVRFSNYTSYLKDNSSSNTYGIIAYRSDGSYYNLEY